MARKLRFCWVCGAMMGVWDDRHFDRTDTCGRSECEREARQIEAEARLEAHEKLDRDMGWDR